MIGGVREIAKPDVLRESYRSTDNQRICYTQASRILMLPTPDRTRIKRLHWSDGNKWMTVSAGN